MTHSSRRILLPAIAAVFLFASLLQAADAKPAGAKSESKQKDILLTTMQQELQRATTELGKVTPSPYFLSYEVQDQSYAVAFGEQGTLVSSLRARRRTADVITHVGTAALDNTHESSRTSAIHSGELATDDDPNAIARELWRLTYQGYRNAAKSFLNVKTQTTVNAKEEDTSADFSEEKPQVHLDYTSPVQLEDQAKLEALVRKYSGRFRNYPYIYQSAVIISSTNGQTHLVNNEGTRLVYPHQLVRLAIQAVTRADDGMELMRVETFQADSLAQLPGEAEIDAKIEKMAADIKALRTAALAEPYDGPALLSGRAAAVFFHEVLGHRLEGQRQRGEDEGRTFAKKIGEKVLPDFLTVADDPTVRTMGGVDLSGSYDYDNEGMPAQRVDLIKNGVLSNYLMARMPIEGFAHSNGHGRAQAGYMPVGRQGNLIVTSTQKGTDAELRQRLIEEVKKRNKPYGLYFEDIEGGFTLTQAGTPQAFQVLPVMVWRVYADGRPDELVRGVDIVGTPLTAMDGIVMTGDRPAVFDGVCGAESGGVPVAAVAPAMLFSEIEVQKRGHALDRPPLLPPPDLTATNVGKGGEQ
jgi:predicted Zn-dependent protease